MSGQLATPRSEWSGTKFTMVAPGLVTAGSALGYSAAELGAGANQYVVLPFVFPMDVVLEGVAAQAVVWSTGVTAINLSIAKAALKAAAPTGALAAGAAARVTEAFDARAATAPPFLEDATKIAHGMYDWKIHPTGGVLNHNVIKRGETLYLHMDAAAATSLANMFLTFRFSTVLK